MRSSAEIKFRLRQEAANLYLAIAQPQFRGTEPVSPLKQFPAPPACLAALRDSAFAARAIADAEAILQHRFPLLGLTLETDAQIDWRRDYAHNKTSEAKYFRRLKYLSFEAVGDHKFIWELNRHQHLVLLAQAHLFTGRADFLQEIWAQLESWLAQNPFQRGINFTSALEVAFRGLSWVWLWHLAGGAMPAKLRARFLTALYQHGWHLFENLSVYFSPNTHLLGEAVALHAIGTLFPEFPKAQTWQKRAGQIVEEQLAFQVKADGSHFEQSTYYHVYALDFLVLYYLLAGKPARLEPALARMAEYLHWLLGPARRIACLGDDDGGRLFHPFGPRDAFGRASMATCGLLFNRPEWIGSEQDLAEQAVWWLGPGALPQAGSYTAPLGAKLFADAGALFFQNQEFSLQFDAGPLGWAGAGHSHADTLSFVLWRNKEPVLTDPGTFTYVGDAVQRERFRGTAAHNTVTIDGLSQAQPAGPFRWVEKPEVTLLAMEAAHDGGFVDAACDYRGFRHRRRLLLAAEEVLVLDEISGPGGDHQIQQFWNLGAGADSIHLACSEETQEVAAEVSPAYGVKVPSRGIRIECRGALPISIATRLSTQEKSGLQVADVRALFDNRVTSWRSA